MGASIQALIDTAGLSGLALIAVSALLGGFIRGFVGFGGALIIVLGVSLAIGPKTAVPVSCLSGIPVMLQLLPTAIRQSERAFVLPFGLAAFAAAPLGALLLISLDPALLKIGIALFVLAMTGMLYRGWRTALSASPWFLAASGAAAGFIQGVAGVGGPPAVALALSRPGTAPGQRANVIGAVSTLTLCTIVPLWLHGLFTLDVILLSLLVVPLYLGSTWFGAKFFTGKGAGLYHNAALSALAAIGTVSLILTTRDYFS